MSDPYIVGVIVDADFGGRLRDLPTDMPVWIVDTTANRAAAEGIWAARPGFTHLNGLTTFVVDPDSTPEVWLADILPNVDLHHGEHSHVPPYAGIEVFGARANSVVRKVLQQLGIGRIKERPGGFIATRSSTVKRHET